MHHFSCQRLGDAQVEIIGKMQQALTMVPRTTYTFRRGTIGSKMVAHWWKGEHVMIGPQQAQMTTVNQIRTLVTQNLRIAIRELVDELGSVPSSLIEYLALQRC